MRNERHTAPARWAVLAQVVCCAALLWPAAVLAEPLVGLAKSATTPEYLGDRVFSTRVSLFVKNMGGVPLSDLKVRDDLGAAFGDRVTWFSVVPGSLFSAELDVNTGYDGQADIELLAPNAQLDFRGRARIAFDVRFQVVDAQGTFFNSAETQTQEGVADVSTNGRNPDPNGDRVPEEREPTPISYRLPAEPRIGVAKQAAETRYLGDRAFSNVIVVTAKNFGDLALEDLQLLEDLQAVFGDGVNDYRVVADSLRSEQLTVNPAFDGRQDTRLLSPGNRLAPGSEAQLQFTVRYEPVAAEGVFSNRVLGRCRNCVEDLSTNGLDPDPDRDNLPSERTPTPLPYQLPLPIGAVLGLAKTATAGKVIEGGVRETTIALRLQNFGDVPATRLQIEDDLATTFAAALPFNVVPGTLRSAALDVNPSFNGDTDRRLLSGTDALAPGAQAVVQFQARFSVTPATGKLFNTARATGADDLVDQSTNGPDPDPNDDQVPDESDPTPIPYELPPAALPVPGLAKRLDLLERLDEDRYRLRFVFELENLGSVPLTELQLIEDLRATFPAPASASVLAVRSELLAINPSYDGAMDPNVLRGDDVLAAGSQASVALTLELRTPPGERYLNSAELVGAAGVIDRSTDGSDPDPNDDGVPDEAEPTPVVIPIVLASQSVPVLEIQVTPRPRVTRIGRLVGYTIEVTNSLDLPQPDVQVVDRTPTGFRPDSAKVVLQRAGPDGLFDTADDERAPLPASGVERLSFAPFDLAPREVVRIAFPSRVTSTARVGPHPNRSLAVSAVSTEVSDDAVVDVIADSLFEKATVIGKVFHDKDGDGQQSRDGTEPGVAGAQLVTPEGLVIRSDQHGRYHIADIDVPERSGLNYVVKLDASSLPMDPIVVTDPRQIARLSPGGLAKLNFGVQWVERPGEDPCCGDFEHLDYLGPWPVTKKLAAELRAIDIDPASGQRRLQFDLSSNYSDVAACMELAVLKPGQSTPLASVKHELRKSSAQVVLPLARTNVAQRFSYVLYAHGLRGRSGKCQGLFEHVAQDFSAVDATAPQVFEMPAGSYNWPAQAKRLGSQLAADRIMLPAVLPQLSVRRYDAGFKFDEHLSANEEAVQQRVSHQWQATEIDNNATTDLRSGNALEVAGFRLPAQDGGDLGSVRIERDAGQFNDGMSFSAQGMTARIECCDLPSEIETVLDPQNAVYAVKFTNRHTATLQVCLDRQPSAQVPSVRVAAQRCWDRPGEQTLTVAPGQRIEFFEGRFGTDAPQGAQDWEALYVFVREVTTGGRVVMPEDPRNGFKILRERVDGELWTLPKTVGLCGDIASEIDITQSVGVAAQKLAYSGSDGQPLPGIAGGGFGERLRSDLFVGVVDLTIGGYSADGALESFARNIGLDDGFLGLGRLAGYWRGSRYLGADNQRRLQWTLQLDSSKDELGRLGSNLSRKDPRRLFRQLDADNYYPTYGDDSTTLLDTDSQGAFYARIVLDDSYAGWGNYSANFSDTEFAAFSRTLYGLNAEHHSTDRTRFGAHRYAFKLFGSEAQTVSAHAAFLATGGSLYYLSHTDVVLGSEQVRVEVRRRGTEQLEERRYLVAGVDYEMDALQGRIILSQPLLQLMRERRNPVVRSESQRGDQVYLAVDYEYVPQGFSADEFVYGMRAKGWVHDRLQLGATHVTDEQGAGDYSLTGLDLLFRYSEDSYLSAEYADTSAATALAPLLSFDGGLSFARSQDAQGGGDGTAVGFEGQWALADAGLAPGYLRAWYKQRQSGYVSSRFAGGAQVRDAGIDLEIALNASTSLHGGYTQLRRRGVSDEQSAWLQLSKEWDCAAGGACWNFDIEARHDDVEAPGPLPIASLSVGLFEQALTTEREGTGSALGLRLAKRISGSATLYGSVQQSLAADREYGSNDRVAVGLNQRVNDQLAVAVEASDGQRGSAIAAGVDYSPGVNTLFNVATGVGSGATTQFSTRYQLSDGHALYGSYAVSPDRTDQPRNMLSLGQRRDFGNRTRVYSESQFGEMDRAVSTGHLFGVDLALSDQWVVAGTLQASAIERPEGDIERMAVSLGAVVTTAAARLSTRVELRDDDGAGANARQYLVSSALGLRVGTGGRLQAKLNAALVEDDLRDLDTGRFAELNLGYAYRPTVTDRLNGMLRYAYLYDVGTEGQSDALGDERSHLFSAEGLFDVSARVQVGAKLAGRRGESRIDKGRGSWDDVRLGLVTARIVLDLSRPRKAASSNADGTERAPNPWLSNRLKLLTEYRWLRDRATETTHEGALVGLYYQIDSRNWNSRFGNSTRIGAGYNFSGFSDDLRRKGYRANGWFIDLTTAF